MIFKPVRLVNPSHHKLQAFGRQVHISQDGTYREVQQHIMTKCLGDSMVRHEFRKNGKRFLSMWNRKTGLVQIFTWVDNQWLLSEQYYA